MTLRFHKLQDFFRGLYWRFLLKKKGHGSKFYGRVSIDYPENVTIGKYSTLNEGVILNAKAPITIGDHVRLSYGCKILSTGLDITKPYLDRPHVSAPIVIHNGAWIGAGVIVLPGIQVGEGATVGAGSVVTKNVDPFTLVMGIPARPFKKLPK